jgi:hypothetical protein
MISSYAALSHFGHSRRSIGSTADYVGLDRAHVVVAQTELDRFRPKGMAQRRRVVAMVAQGLQMRRFKFTMMYGVLLFRCKIRPAIHAFLFCR